MVGQLQVGALFFFLSPNIDLSCYEKSKLCFCAIENKNIVCVFVCTCNVCVIFLQEVGCDFGINSNAKEDSCGVCLGDGSTCETVKENFVKQDGFGV